MEVNVEGSNHYDQIHQWIDNLLSIVQYLFIDTILLNHDYFVASYKKNSF